MVAPFFVWRRAVVMDKKKKKSSLDIYLISALLYIVIWSVAFFLAWIVKGIEPSTLEACILAPGIAEMICTAWIQSGKNKYQNGGKTDGGIEIDNLDDIQEEG